MAVMVLEKRRGVSFWEQLKTVRMSAHQGLARILVHFAAVLRAYRLVGWQSHVQVKKKTKNVGVCT